MTGAVVALTSVVIGCASASSAAASGNTGAGTVEVMVNFDNPVPAAISTNPVGVGGCPLVSWSTQDITVTGSGSQPVPASTAQIVNLAFVWYWGPMGLSVKGHSNQECVYMPSFGTIDSFGATGYNPVTTGNFNCTGNLVGGHYGQYLRVGAAVLVQLSANCSVNGLSTGTIDFTALADLQPTAGTGTVTPIYQAALSGVWEGLT
jgi:hypothetical protein